ncbi:IS110 family RNA-guided transposase [Leucobacter sp. HY1910]
MSIVAHNHPFVVGVDTHARTHTYAIVTSAGVEVDHETFPSTLPGMKRALAWLTRRTGGDLSTLLVIEGIATYGAKLARLAAEAGWEQIAEAPATPPRTRAGRGKSDALDAVLMARAALPIALTDLRRPRADAGARAAVRVLLTARNDIADENTQKMNALIALVRVHELGVDARTGLTRAQVREISRWRHRDELLEVKTARAEAVRLAARLIVLFAELDENRRTLRELLLTTPAAGLLDEAGIGDITAARLYEAWSHLGRLKSEAAFASLAGVNPIPASSGNTVRHRLNRYGDRQLNRALHLIAVTRARCDEATRAYVERRLGEGRTLKEVRRCLKRYIARQVFRQLNAAAAPRLAS